MATKAVVRRKSFKSAANLPVYNRVVRKDSEEGGRERAVRTEYYQQCGGGRRVFRKTLNSM